MADSISDILGKTVTITTNSNGVFTGEIAKMDMIDRRLIMKNVKIEGGRKLLGPQYFQIENINSWNIWDLEDNEVNNNKEVSTQAGAGRTNMSWKEKILKRKIIQPHLSKLRNLDTDDLTTANMCVFAESEEETEEAEDEYEDFYKENDVTMICRVCDKFKDAIVHIMEQCTVAVSFRGVDSGRDGVLSLVQIATESDIILFDIHRMGNEAFIEGLQEVFESKHITKILHDCRYITDLLYHQFNVSLRNVFDTQVANAYVYSLCHGGDWPRFVNNLAACLITHLGLTTDQVFTDKFRERCQQEDQAIWLQRPLPDNLIDLSVKNLRYMIKLQSVLIDKMLLVFKVGVDLYLNNVKESPRSNVDKYRVNRHLLPCAFMDIQKYVDYHINNTEDFDYQKSEMNWVRFHNKGFRENLVPLSEKTVVRSHDSIWHRSEEFYANFRNRPQSDNQSKSSGIPAEEKNFRRPKSSVGHSSLYVENTKSCDSSRQAVKYGQHHSNSSSFDQDKSDLLNTPETSASSTSSISPSPPLISSSSTNELPPLEPVPNNDVLIPMIEQDSPPKSFSDATSECEVNHVNNKSQIQDLLKKSKLYSRSKNLLLARNNLSKKAEISEKPKDLPSRESEDSLVQQTEKNFLELELEKLSRVGFVSKKELSCVDVSGKKNSADFSDSASPSAKYVKSNYEKPSQVSVDSPQKSLDPRKFGFRPSSGSETEIPSGNKVELNSGGRLIPNMVPAGLQQANISKKKQNQLKELQRHQNFPGNDERSSRKIQPEQKIDDDFGVIPNQISLHRRVQYPLGRSAHTIGDPFSEGFDSFESENSYIDTQIKLNKEHAITDSDISDAEQTELFRKVKHAANSVIASNVKSKLLPSRIKPGMNKK